MTIGTYQEQNTNVSIIDSDEKKSLFLHPFFPHYSFSFFFFIFSLRGPLGPPILYGGDPSPRPWFVLIPNYLFDFRLQDAMHLSICLSLAHFSNFSAQRLCSRCATYSWLEKAVCRPCEVLNTTKEFLCFLVTQILRGANKSLRLRVKMLTSKNIFAWIALSLFLETAARSSNSRTPVRYSVICPNDPKLREMIKQTDSSNDSPVQCSNPLRK